MICDKAVSDYYVIHYLLLCKICVTCEFNRFLSRNVIIPLLLTIVTYNDYYIIQYQIQGFVLDWKLNLKGMVNYGKYNLESNTSYVILFQHLP